MPIKELEFPITPGLELEYDYEYTNGEAASAFTEQEDDDGYFHLVRFKAAETSNVHFSLENLNADLDLYLVPEIKYTEENLPGTSYLTRPRLIQDGGGNWLTLWSDSSSNWGTESEHFFRQLNPIDEELVSGAGYTGYTGYYYLAIGAQNNFEETIESGDLSFSLKIDSKTFDETTLIPNDPLLDKQWYLFNSADDSDSTKNLRTDNIDIHAPEAWKIRHDASDIIVAVIDTGIDTSHPDLKNNLWINPKEIPNNGADDDDNGFKDDIHGWNFAANSPNIETGNHGTHVAGTIGASGNNGIGITGVAWNTQLMSLDVFGGDLDNVDYDEDAAAIRYAVDNGAKVINMSIGSNSKIRPDEFLATFDRNSELGEALQHAKDQDVFIAVAAGNEAEDDTQKWQDVGNLDKSTSKYGVFNKIYSNIAAVGATNAQDARANYSNYGKSVDISAPGGQREKQFIWQSKEDGTSEWVITEELEIFSTVVEGSSADYEDYGYLSGTSMAAPVISGMAALIRAEDSSITAPETLAILRAGARVSDDLKGKVNGGLSADLEQSLLISQAWNGPDTLTQIGQDNAAVLNLSSLTTPQILTGLLTLNREAGDEILIGFYRVADAEGTVLDALGNSIKPGDSNYQSIALNAGNLVDGLTNLEVNNNASKSWDYTLSGLTSGAYLAPYAITADNTWFAWSEANSDGLDHFKVLDANRFGLEDLAGLDSDQDFNDMVMSFASKQIL